MNLYVVLHNADSLTALKQKIADVMRK